MPETALRTLEIVGNHCTVPFGLPDTCLFVKPNNGDRRIERVYYDSVAIRQQARPHCACKPVDLLQDYIIDFKSLQQCTVV